MSFTLDHLTILSRSPEKSAAFYGFILPRLGFVQDSETIWRNPDGLYLQFARAMEETADYARYAPGLNHFGFSAPDSETVRELAAALGEAGYEARLQQLPRGITALFAPDPDGLRIEISHYPSGVPPVG
jgi:lactoylglutathione lyase